MLSKILSPLAIAKSGHWMLHFSFISYPVPLFKSSLGISWSHYFLLRVFYSSCLGLWVVFLHTSLSDADSINFLNDFRNNDLTGIITGLFKLAEGYVDDTIDQSDVNSWKVTGSEPNHLVAFYRKNSRDVRGYFSSGQFTNIAGLDLDSLTSEALINFISASAF